MPNGTCGVLCFGPKGGTDGAMRFTNALRLIAIETHVADARSCVLHPASHTHSQLNEEQLAAYNKSLAELQRPAVQYYPVPMVPLFPQYQKNMQWRGF
jgi:O-acetylhomoserine/O-acetylserine sulfhydrylase-like pyridoxal-dependent enzyme